MTLPTRSTTLGLLMLCCLASAAYGQKAVPFVEYLQLPEEDTAAYLKMQEASHAYHQRLLDEGKLYGWYTYEQLFPRGTTAPFNRVVVSVFKDAADIPERNKHRQYGRHVAMAEEYVALYNLRNPDYESLPTDFDNVNFLRVDAKNEQAFLTHMETTMKPMYNDLVASGTWKTWGIFQRTSPSSDTPYNYVLVVRLDDFAAAEAAPPWDDDQGSGAMTGGKPTLVRSVIWKKNDFVLPGYNNTTSSN